MALTNYTDLQTTIADWLHRTDLTSQIVDFIDLAESEINSDVRMRVMEVDESVTLTVSTRTIALPSRYIEPISLEIVLSGQENIPLIYKPQPQLAVNASSGARARPQFYAINGDNIEFANLSDATYSMQFRMRKGFDLASTTTNSLMTNYPGIYLYGALLQAAPYLVNDQRIQVWQMTYDRLMKKVIRKEGRSKALTSLITDHPSAGNPGGWRENVITG